MPLPPEIYDREYFLSHSCEGVEEFLEDRGLSMLKRHQVEILRPGPGIRFLDAGCGRGEVMLACAQAGAEVAGIDYSEAAVDIARETLADVPGAEVVHGDLLALPWPDRHFDRVLLGDVIEHLDPDQADRALAEIRRVMKDGGVVLVHTAPNKVFLTITWPVARVVLKLIGFRETVERADFWIEKASHYHVNEQTVHSLRRVVRRAGFSHVHAWLEPDVLREGAHHLTADLSSSPLMRIAGRIARLRPLRLLLSNDVNALAQR